jgi:CRP-like cAMP-binding protein
MCQNWQHRNLRALSFDKDFDEMDLMTFLSQSPAMTLSAAGAEFAALWKTRLIRKGAFLTQQGEKETQEYILLDGCATSQIHASDGTAVCVGLYHGPSVITPHIARTKAQLSRVAIEATTDLLVAQMDAERLVEEMIRAEPVRNWANAILQDALARKADREWCLAALRGADRLAWFRDNYPGYEALFVHTSIASFLGVTPVTLSRLRGQQR